MACRVARSYQDHIRTDLLSCCECGSSHLKVVASAHTSVPYLCPVCAQSKVEEGVEKEIGLGTSALAKAACQDQVSGPIHK